MRALTPTDAFYLTVCDPTARAYVGILPLSYLHDLYPVPDLTEQEMAAILLDHSRTWVNKLMGGKISKIKQASALLHGIEASNVALRQVLIKYNRTHFGYNSDTYRLSAFIHDDLRATYPTAHPRYIDETAVFLATGAYLHEVYRSRWAPAYIADALPHAEHMWRRTTG